MYHRLLHSINVSETWQDVKFEFTTSRFVSNSQVCNILREAAMRA